MLKRLFFLSIILIIWPNISTAAIYSAEVSNISSGSFFISWVSDVAQTGEIQWGPSPDNINISTPDIRELQGTTYDPDFVEEQGAAGQTHYVKIDGVAASTTYYYQIKSGSIIYTDNGQPFQVTTAPAVPPIVPNIFSGGLVQDTFGENASGVIVRFSFYNPITGAQSSALSAISRPDGSYFLESGSAALTNDLSGRYLFDLDTDYLSLYALGGNLGNGQFSGPASSVTTLYPPATWNLNVDLQLTGSDGPLILPFPVGDFTFDEDEPDIQLINLNNYVFFPGNINTLVWTPTSNDNPSLLTAAVTNSRFLAINLAENQSGAASIGIVVAALGGEGSDAGEIAITVNSVNDAPIFVDVPPFDLENPILLSLGQTYSETLTATDVDHASEELTFSLVDAPAGMTLNPQSGYLEWTPLGEPAGLKTIIVRVTDPAGGLAEAQFFIQLLAGSPPEIDPLPPVNFDEDDTGQIHMTDYVTSETPLAELTWEWISQTEPSVIAVDFDSTTFIATFSAPENWFGSETFWVTASNEYGQNDLEDVVVTVISINDSPEFSPLPPVVIMEDTIYTFIISDYVSDVDNELPELSLVMPTVNNLTFDLNTANNEVTITPNPNWYGSREITFIVRDPSGAEDSAAMAFNTLPVNDPPNLSLPANISALEDTPESYNFNSYATDIDDSVITWVFDGADHVQITHVNATSGEISITPEANWFGSDTLRVTITDFGGFTGSNLMSATASLILFVTQVNDPPQFSFTPVTAAAEGVLYDAAATAVDTLDGSIETVLYSLTTAPVGMSINAESGQFHWTPGNYQVGAHNVTVMANDGHDENNTAIVEFTITVENTNNPPDIIPINDQTVMEGALFQLQVAASDSDLVHGLEVLTFSDNTELFDINPSSGQISFTASNADVGEHLVTITVTDSEDASDETAFTLTIQNVNNSPHITGFPALIEFAEDTVYSDFDLDDYVVDLDDDPADLTWESPGNAAIGVEIDPVTHVAVFTPAPNHATPTGWLEVISFTVTDTSDSTDTASLFLKVLPVNDVPEPFWQISPADGDTTDLSVNLEWNDTTDIEDNDVLFLVQYGPDPDLNTFTEFDTYNTSLHLSGLPDETRFYWRVGAQDNEGAVTWTDIWSFYCFSQVAVRLSSFQAVELPGAVELHWSIAATTDLLGFDVYRHTTNNPDNAQRINDQLVMGSGEFQFSDRSGSTDTPYYYWLHGLEVTGQVTVFGPVTGSPLPTALTLFRNYPNPFTHQTTLRYSLAGADWVTVAVYNPTGQLIVELVNENQSPGRYQVVWDGRDARGLPVGSGTYLYRLKTGDGFAETRSMTLVK